MERRFLTIESDLIKSILKLTIDGPVSKELINKNAKIASILAQKLLRKLQKEDLIYVQGGILAASNVQRVKMAVSAIQAGADLEEITALLQWREFEAIAVVAFRQNGYETIRNLRFKNSRRRFEIDIVGCMGSLAVCADCKHWKKGLSRSVLRKIVEEQAERTSALAESLPNLSIKNECLSRRATSFVPAVLSLAPTEFKFCEEVPVVPILQLQDFLTNVPAFADSLRHFKRSPASLRIDL